MLLLQTKFSEDRMENNVIIFKKIKMNSQTTKKLFAFTFFMMFSFSYLNAQCAPGEVLMSKGGGKTRCTQKCVKLNQENQYLKKGWAPFGCPVGGLGISPFIAQTNKTPNKKKSNKPLIKNPAENAIVSNKAFRRQNEHLISSF